MKEEIMNDDYSVKNYVTGMHHVGFFCSDLEETVKFYTDILGFKVMLWGEVKSKNERLAMLQHGGLILEILWLPDTTLTDLYERAKGVLTHFSLKVTDIEAVKSKLLKHPKVVFEEEEIRYTPNIGGADYRVTFFRGINGERVELMQDVSGKKVSA
jgi:catechol 2,3-dioxygenase-like lactoylglutathione lyase family enzyme